MARLQYYLNGYNLESEGVIVKTNDGLIGVPEFKERQSADFLNANGIILDTSKPRLRERHITLECAIDSNNITGIYDKLRTITNKGQLTQLVVIAGNNEPLVYNVVAETTEPEKKWHNGVCLCEFEILMIEAVPTKIVMKTTFTGLGTCTIKFNPNGKVFDLNWGDGTIEYDISGTSLVTKTHTYSSGATRYPIISGDVEEISNLTATNAETIWTIK